MNPMLLVGTIAAIATAPTTSLRTDAACAIVHARAKHIGETVTFRGAYEGDFERQVIIPEGCDRGIGVGAAAPEVEPILEGGPFRGVITGVLYQVKPNNFQFHNDDGVRLRITNVRIVSRAHSGD